MSASRDDSGGSGLAAQHDQLDRFAAEVVAALELGDRGRASEVLRWFHSALAAHFVVEEEIVFVAVCGIDPDLGADFETLRRQHGAFLLHLTQLDRLVENADPEVARAVLDRFLEDLHDHERHEERILGVKD